MRGYNHSHIRRKSCGLYSPCWWRRHRDRQHPIGLLQTSLGRREEGLVLYFYTQIPTKSLNSRSRAQHHYGLLKSSISFITQEVELNIIRTLSADSLCWSVILDHCKNSSRAPHNNTSRADIQQPYQVPEEKNDLQQCCACIGILHRALPIREPAAMHALWWTSRRHLIRNVETQLMRHSM